MMLAFAGLRSKTTRSQIAWLSMLLLVHVTACCWSLVTVAEYYSYLNIIGFDKARLGEALLCVAPSAVILLLFTISRFSFGYFAGFYLHTMLIGYLWICRFSPFKYDHALAALSLLASGLAFLLPALFINTPIRQRLVLSERTLNHLLSAILIFATLVVATGALQNFRIVGVADIYKFRDRIALPGFLNYSIGISSGALLPFSFACYVAQKRRLRAAAAAGLLLLIYPITLAKLVLLAPFWLLFLLLLSRLFEARIAVVFSLFLPVAAGLLLDGLFRTGWLSYGWLQLYFGTVNFRMIAFPSIGLDVYSDFFSNHNLTHFCQIWLLKPFVICPYAEPLSVVMSNNYHLGYFNASMFATEGIASVGPWLAPLAMFACGLVISLANRISSDLSPTFVLLSGGILAQDLLNIPFATNLLTSGAAVLFVLWYVTPRSIFRPEKTED